MAPNSAIKYQITPTICANVQQNTKILASSLWFRCDTEERMQYPRPTPLDDALNNGLSLLETESLSYF